MIMRRRSGPVAIVPAVAVDDARVSPVMLHVLAALASYANGDGECYPKVETLAARLGMWRQNVSRSLKQLERLGYVTIVRRHGPETGRQIASLYRINFDVPIPPEHQRPEHHPADTAGVARASSQRRTEHHGADADRASPGRRSAHHPADTRNYPTEQTNDRKNQLNSAAGAAGRTRRGPRPTDVPDDVRAAIAELPTELTAAVFHDELVAALTARGYRCEREVHVANRGDGRGGRLDVVAERDGVRIAFELDDRTPRSKSVLKLQHVPDAVRVVVLRSPLDGRTAHPSGVDAVLGAGSQDARRRDSSGRAVQVATLTPLTERDRRVWEQARQAATVGWTAGNAELVAGLEPIGRGPDGGLRLRAPPGQGLGRFRALVMRALSDAGDEAGRFAAIV